MLTPQTVYRGRVDEVLSAHQSVLDVALATHPERFVKGRSVAKRPPSEVWINTPTAQHVVVGEPPAEST